MSNEEIRDSHRPDKVKLLFVGESPPASGKFFYRGGAMTAFTMKAFMTAYDISFADQKEFLHAFKAFGCFLDDLSLRPVNRLKGREREQALQDSVESLSDRIRSSEPVVVIAVFRKIEEYVRQAVDESGVPATLCVLPSPGYGHQNKYVQGLVEILRKYLSAQPARVRRVFRPRHELP
jgi:hypothetical protein